MTSRVYADELLELVLLDVPRHAFRAGVTIGEHGVRATVTYPDDMAKRMPGVLRDALENHLQVRCIQEIARRIVKGVR